jgi:predicted O-linked N-acetylglucosamine transferase (SPINDLY family)
LLLAERKPEQAHALLQRHAGTSDLDTLALLAMTAGMLGRHEQAEFHARRVCELAPGSAPAWTNLGVILLRKGHAATKPDDEPALACFEKALALDERAAEARLGIVNLLIKHNALERAKELCDRGLEMGMHERLAASAANVYLSLGLLDGTRDLLRRAIGAFPQNPALRSALCAMLLYDDTATPGAIAQAHREFGRVMASLSGPPRRPVGSGMKDGRLRVGVLSSDLRRHSVSLFARCLFEHLDRGRFHVTGYFNHTEPDAVTREFEALADRWRFPLPEGDAQLADLIEADGIDVLIELNGHSRGHRLGAVALKPAPVIVTYCGYPETTGLEAIDYRIVDSTTDPPGSEDRATEELLRLDPCFLCFTPPKDAPPPARVRAAGEAPVFGSFNTARKLSPATIALWSRLLREVPDARLVLKSGDLDPARTLGAFGAHGVADRVECLPATAGYAQHLEMYARIDVGLDPFPYHGTTTTLEAFWMGVPVVTLLGDRHAARVGGSLLAAVDLQDLVATGEEQYVSIATRLVQDRVRLDELRRGLRECVRTGLLGDGRAFASRLGETLLRVAGKGL